MIPKVIHYCWVGGKPLSEMATKCINSWKKYCPDYEIIEWNESNYDFSKNEYMRAAYENKKWGFVPDYARLDIIYQYGGIYLDTDVEVIKPFDELLSLSGFVGMEKTGQVNLGQGFGAEPHNDTLKKMRDMYNELIFNPSPDYLATHASPVYQTELLNRLGLVCENKIQQIDQLTVLPVDYLCPKNMDTGIVSITDNTYSIHHFDGTWAESTERYGYHLKWKCIDRYGERLGRIIYYIIYSFFIVKNDGIIALVKKIKGKSNKINH